MHGLPKRQIRLFLHHLWAAGGSVTVRGDGGRVSYSSTSRRMIDGAASLLLRFGITGRVRTVRSAHVGPRYALDISGRDDQLRFLREISVHGDQGAACVALLSRLEGVRSNVDTIPAGNLARGSRRRWPITAMSQPGPSRQRLARVAAVLDGPTSISRDQRRVLG